MATTTSFVDVSLLDPCLFAVSAVTASQPWTTEEDQKLQQLVAIHGPKNWSHVAELVVGRTGKQCRERWRNHIDPCINKQPFSPEEDQLIVALVEEMGTKWSKIAQNLPGRTDNAIKNRFYSSLLKKSHERRLNRFSAQEDALIIAVVRRIGTKWSEVSKFLPGRTSKSIKNRYYSALKKTYPVFSTQATSHAPQSPSAPSTPTTPTTPPPPSTLQIAASAVSSSADSDCVDDTGDSSCASPPCVVMSTPQSPKQGDICPKPFSLRPARFPSVRLLAVEGTIDASLVLSAARCLCDMRGL